jgi:NAD(P)-dependent dehydrogenase (short-subunit alcohol dehydrogenase family)
LTTLNGRTVVITGGNSGIGKQTAFELAHMGAHVVIAARNAAKAAAAVQEVSERADAHGRVETIPIDLGSFASVHAFADAFCATHDHCGVLVNNAGLVLGKRTITEDGHEATFQINHLSHFLLTHLLAGKLRSSAPARVVNVASEAHRFARKGLDFDDLDWQQRRYRPWGAYGASKLANILFTRELARRWDGTGVTANVVHPGFVASNFAKDGDYGWVGRFGMPIARPFAISVEKGAATSVYVASSPQVEGVSGQYFAKSTFASTAATGEDPQAAERLWEISAKLTGVS